MIQMTVHYNRPIYVAGVKEAYRICRGRYMGHNYYILSMGTHPCAYVELRKDDKYYGVDYEYIPVLCHGDLTYSKSYLKTVWNKGWFIGWDYAHSGDHMEYKSAPISGKKYTTEEIEEECRSVIRQLVELERK